jgi:aminomethyltransferase
VPPPQSSAEERADDHLANSDPALRHSPLEPEHLELGAKMVPFGGWYMPLAYPSGTLAEHRACRQSAVAFDVSHLGTVRVEGSDAFGRLQSVFTNDLRKVTPGRAQYTHLLDDDASVLDDLIVWWLSDTVFDVMPNASNTSRVREAIGGQDTTSTRAVIAVQGPDARRVVAAVAPEASSVPRFAVRSFEWKGVQCLVAGTGYTGEDGVECAVPAEEASSFWHAVLSEGALPAGLGARDTLRLEAGLPLHGHELGPGISPLQAGLGWVVAWDKGPFRGREALEAERQRGPKRRLRGLVAESRQPLRDGALVLTEERVAGHVTSGNFSPVLERGIGMALIDTSAGLEDGAHVQLDLRGKSREARLSGLRFVGPKAPHAGAGTA